MIDAKRIKEIGGTLAAAAIVAVIAARLAAPSPQNVSLAPQQPGSGSFATSPKYIAATATTQPSDEPTARAQSRKFTGDCAKVLIGEAGAHIVRHVRAKLDDSRWPDIPTSVSDAELTCALRELGKLSGAEGQRAIDFLRGV